MAVGGAEEASAARPNVGDDAVSRLRAALGGQSFSVAIAEGGAAVLTDADTGEHLTTLSSAFSMPGPLWQQNFSNSADSAGWQVQVDRSKAADGRWTVVGVGKTYTVGRLYVLDPVPPAKPRRLLINDTITTTGSRGANRDTSHSAGPVSAEHIVGIAVRHQATVAAAISDVDTAVIPGAYGGWQCSTHGNPGDTCGVGCFNPAAKRTNNGRPDVFANRSAGGASFGVGLVALDDSFRVHAQTLQAAMATGPRMEGMNMSCPVSDPPIIGLSDPNLGLLKSGEVYTMEFALYAFRPRPNEPRNRAAQQGTDFYSFVNAQRHDLGSDTIPMERTGFLGPASSLHGDMSAYKGTGYSTCINQTAVDAGINPNSKAQRAVMGGTCWEHWDPSTFLAFLQKQGGPGGFVHISNGDMIGDKNNGCGQVTIDGNRFVDPTQRPADFDRYWGQVVNQTARANALLPAGAPHHKVVWYTDNFASTGVNDSSLFADSLVKSKDGTQQAYTNCTKPGGPIRTQLASFYADGTNSFSGLLRKYYELALERGADGIFHDEFPASNFHVSLEAILTAICLRRDL